MILGTSALALTGGSPFRRAMLRAPAHQHWKCDNRLKQRSDEGWVVDAALCRELDRVFAQ